MTVFRFLSMRVAVAVAREAVESLRREWHRLMPMSLGIVWGVASIFLLGAISKGFERDQRAVVEAFGDSFMLLRLNKPTSSRGDSGTGREIRIDYEDIEKIRAGSPAVEAVSPKGDIWRAQAVRGDQQTWMRTVGVDPEYSEICNVPLEPGSRWIDENDIANAHPVVVIGFRAREELFGSDPCIGEVIKLSIRGGGEDPYARELTVIGAIRDVEITDEFYVSNRGVGFIPFTLFERLEATGTGFLVVRPRSIDRRDEALAQIREVLADRYHIDPADEGTVLPYFDGLDRSQRLDRVFDGMRLFLGAVGLLILLLGAVGVANVVLMSVTARTHEFGVRRAIGCRRRWIFSQVFLEAGLVCLLSGAGGFLLGMGLVRLMSGLPLPDGFPAPIPDLTSAGIAVVLLGLVSLSAALWPATRAVRVDPVVALRRGAL